MSDIVERLRRIGRAELGLENLTATAADAIAALRARVAELEDERLVERGHIMNHIRATGDALLERGDSSGQAWLDAANELARVVFPRLPLAEAIQRSMDNGMRALAAEARVAELEAALRRVNAHASPRAEGRTLDELSGDLYWCACEARRALEPADGR